MRRNFFIVLTVFLFAVLDVTAQVKIIFDTDHGSDDDNLGALVMLHNFHNRSECELLAIVANQDVSLAVDLYREILSKQKDNSVKIVTVRPLANIEDLLNDDDEEKIK